MFPPGSTVHVEPANTRGAGRPTPIANRKLTRLSCRVVRVSAAFARAGGIRPCQLAVEDRPGRPESALRSTRMRMRIADSRKGSLAASESPRRCAAAWRRSGSALFAASATRGLSLGSALFAGAAAARLGVGSALFARCSACCCRLFARRLGLPGARLTSK